MRSQIKRLVTDERGAEAIDYVLVLGLVVIAALVLMGALGVKITARWREIVNALGMD